jgi:hypothetical protein
MREWAVVPAEELRAPNRQLRDLRSGLRLGHPQFIGALQVEPELRVRAEPMAEAKRRDR